jgi:hypothetical protein
MRTVSLIIFLIALFIAVSCAPQPPVQKRDFCELSKIFYVGEGDNLSRPLAEALLAHNRLYKRLCEQDSVR